MQANINYGLGLEMKTTAPRTIPKTGKAKVPLELEKGELPLNTFGNKAPFSGKIVSVERIVGPKATGETTHIIIEYGGKMPYWEGQSYGVIPPGAKVNSKGKEVPHGVRLYSIASSRYGDAFDGKTATLCVRRATYWDPELNKEDPAKKGICSNFLCDAKPGEVVQMTGALQRQRQRQRHSTQSCEGARHLVLSYPSLATCRVASLTHAASFVPVPGPTGKVMLLPEDPSTVHIMVATGTGIAPFRSYVRRFFCEDVPNYNFKGLAWLFMGVANSDAKLYDDEFQALIARYPDQFRLDYALSREQNNSKGGKMYIQDKVEEYKDQVFDLLNNGAHMYFCGLKGMMPGILDMLEKVCAEKNLKFEDWLEKLKHEGRWVRARAAPACTLARADSRAPRLRSTWRSTKLDSVEPSRRGTRRGARYAVCNSAFYVSRTCDSSMRLLSHHSTSTRPAAWCICCVGC